MKNLKNVTSFEDFLKEKFSLKAIKDLLIKPLPPKPQEEEDFDIDTNQEFKVYLFANKHIKDFTSFRMVNIVKFEVVDRKEFANTYKDLNIDVNDKDKDKVNTLVYDINGKSFTFINHGKPAITFNAIVDKIGQKIVHQLLKENDIDIKLKDIPSSGTGSSVKGLTDSMKALLGEDIS